MKHGIEIALLLADFCIWLIVLMQAARIGH